MMSKPYVEHVNSLLASAQKRVIIIAAFIKSDTLHSLLANINQGVDISIFVRWRIIDIVSGVTDVDIVDIARKAGAKIRMHEDLHAKIYIADNRALVGSANVTAAGLGISQRNNIEILLETCANCKAVSNVLAELENKSSDPIIPHEDIDFQLYKPISDLLINSNNWLPSCLPDDIFNFCNSGIYTSDNVVKDSLTLGLSFGSSQSKIKKVVCNQHIFKMLKEKLQSGYSRALTEKEIINLICNQFNMSENIAQNKCNFLMQWISEYTSELDMYISRTNELKLGNILETW